MHLLQDVSQCKQIREILHVQHEVSVCVVLDVLLLLACKGVDVIRGEGFSQGLTEVKVSVRVVLLISHF